MSKHYTLNTVSDTKWCNKCKGFTAHRVANRRIDGCIPCIDKLEKRHAQKPVDDFRREFNNPTLPFGESTTETRRHGE